MSDTNKDEPARVSPEFEEFIPGFVRYTGRIPFDQLPFPPCAREEDYDWVWGNREMHQRYQGLVVAVRDRTVWGVGKTSGAAWEDARQKADCPAEDDLIFVPIWGMPWQDANAADGSGRS